MTDTEKLQAIRDRLDRYRDPQTRWDNDSGYCLEDVERILDGLPPTT